VLDPGHGGKDTGTKTKASKRSPQVLEKNLALRTSKTIEEFLQKWGYNVLMTRKSDVFIPLIDRAAFAKKHSCSLFVSIHYNSAPNKAAHGIEVYYYNKADKRRLSQSKLLGKDILARLKALKRPHIRGCFPANFCVLRETTMPAVLVEAGFLSNIEEAKSLRNPHYIRLISWSIAKGIDDFAKKSFSK
jgi:N-acetylmuramoyl-L-alanine amidase